MKLKYISWLPSVLIMATIFYFSAKPDTNSNESSMLITNRVIKLYEALTDTQNQNDISIETMEQINLIIRKTAHFCEYALLAASFALHFILWKQKGKRLFIAPVILASLYAATDEFHQTFVPGRSGQWKDVFLDTSGAVIGSLIIFLIVVSANRKKEKLQQKSLDSSKPI